MSDEWKVKMANGKAQMTKAKRGGFTFVDLLIVVVTVLLLVTILMPWVLARSAKQSKKLNCASQLKSVGLAYRMWANDNEWKFPMRVSTQQDGTMEYNETGQVFRQFEALSNQMNSPILLACPNDTNRVRTNTWSGLSNKNISYFVGLEADETKPQTILCGDRNVVGGVFSKGNVMLCRSNTSLSWTTALHNGAGNIGLGDGSVQQVTDQGLQKQLQAEFQSVTNEVIRLAIP